MTDLGPWGRVVTAKPRRVHAVGPSGRGLDLETRAATRPERNTLESLHAAKNATKLAGVSTTTVSRVVNSSGYASPDAKARVKKAIDELGYMPNGLARQLRAKRTDTIALAVTDKGSSSGSSTKPVGTRWLARSSRGIAGLVADRGDPDLRRSSADELCISGARVEAVVAAGWIRQGDGELEILSRRAVVGALIRAVRGEGDGTGTGTSSAGTPNWLTETPQTVL